MPRPEEVAGPGSECVEGAVRVADEHTSVGDGRRRVEVLTSAQEARVGRRAPDLMAGARVERIDVAAVVAEEDAPVRVRNRCVDLVPGREAPQQARVRPAPYVQRIHVVVPGAEVQNAVDEQGRRLDSAGPVAPEDLAAVAQNAALRPEEDRDDE